MPRTAERTHRMAQPLSEAGNRPLHVHARYSRDEALDALGLEDLDGPWDSGIDGAR